jgi:hypothetical protein
MQTNIAQIIGTNYALAAGFQDITGGTAQDDIAQVPTCRGLCVFGLEYSTITGLPAGCCLPYSLPEASTLPITLRA